MIDADRGIGQVDEEHARALPGLCHHDADARALRTGDEGLAAVDYPVVAVEVAGCLHYRRVRFRPALVGGFGHKQGRTDSATDLWFKTNHLEFGEAFFSRPIKLAPD